MTPRSVSGRDNPARDQSLLDVLKRLPAGPFEGTVWRSVRKGRDPLVCGRSTGRWDDGTFDVLYTSTTLAVAIEERRFHLYQGQPIPPSKVRYELFELSVSLEAAITFRDRTALSDIGLDIAQFGELSYVEREAEYPGSQQIGKACMFRGADGILVPSARGPKGLNLVVFCEQNTRIEKKIVRNHGVVDLGQGV